MLCTTQYVEHCITERAVVCMHAEEVARDGYATDSDPDDETHWPYRRAQPPRRQHRRLPRQSPLDWLFAAPSAAPSAGGQSTAGYISSAQPAAGWSSAAAVRVSAADALPEQLSAGAMSSVPDEVVVVAASEISDLLCCPITHVSSLAACICGLSMPLCLPPFAAVSAVYAKLVPSPSAQCHAEFGPAAVRLPLEPFAC